MSDFKLSAQYTDAIWMIDVSASMRERPHNYKGDWYFGDHKITKEYRKCFGNSPMRDAMKFAVDHGYKRVVMVTDGHDTGSHTSMKQLLEMMKGSDIDFQFINPEIQTAKASRGNATCVPDKKAPNDNRHFAHR